MPDLCEPAQPKYDDFVRKLTGKMSGATDTTSIEHRALTLSVRTPSVWPHCLGKNSDEETNRHENHHDDKDTQKKFR